MIFHAVASISAVALPLAVVIPALSFETAHSSPGVSSAQARLIFACALYSSAIGVALLSTTRGPRLVLSNSVFQAVLAVIFGVNALMLSRADSGPAAQLALWVSALATLAVAASVFAFRRIRRGFLSAPSISATSVTWYGREILLGQICEIEPVRLWNGELFLSGLFAFPCFYFLLEHVGRNLLSPPFGGITPAHVLLAVLLMPMSFLSGMTFVLLGLLLRRHGTRLMLTDRGDSVLPFPSRELRDAFNRELLSRIKAGVVPTS